MTNDKLTGGNSHHYSEVKVISWGQITRALIQYEDVILPV